jgi:hypothetical protein
MTLPFRNPTSIVRVPRLPLVLAFVLAFTGSISARAVDDEVFLFTYFVGNGESGLHLAWSEDGYAWQSVAGGRSLLRPEVGGAKLMRDPCAVRAADGTFHMVWTSGWWERGIGYASTRDFLHWSPQREIPVMEHEPTARNSWAPEVAWDAERSEYIVFWASTIPGRFPETAGASEDDLNHRMYFTTTRDFESFSPTELFLDPGFSVIDATFLRTDRGLHLVIKDETRHPPAKYLQIATVDDMRGPFGPLSERISPEGVWVEGPTGIRVGDDWIVYYDAYRDRRYGALRSRDLVEWEDVSDRIRFPDEGTAKRVRHGTVLRVERALVEAIDATKTPHE